MQKKSKLWRDQSFWDTLYIWCPLSLGFQELSLSFSKERFGPSFPLWCRRGNLLALAWIRAFYWDLPCTNVCRNSLFLYKAIPTPLMMLSVAFCQNFFKEDSSFHIRDSLDSSLEIEFHLFLKTWNLKLLDLICRCLSYFVHCQFVTSVFRSLLL